MSALYRVTHANIYNNFDPVQIRGGNAESKTHPDVPFGERTYSTRLNIVNKTTKLFGLEVPEDIMTGTMSRYFNDPNTGTKQLVGRQFYEGLGVTKNIKVQPQFDPKSPRTYLNLKGFGNKLDIFHNDHNRPNQWKSQLKDFFQDSRENKLFFLGSGKGTGG